MKKDEIKYTGPLTGTLSEAKEKANSSEEYSQEFEAIQQMWSVNPVDESVYDGTLGYKDN
ncbi:hypothetical protein [Fredinandcohnia quinoae]|uniref:Uncharacterized protein n=1 Tax=Fredinandcohnia quinoae TaxID=2918902 RepID=A0AAW5E6Y8_9BACI|nr:hypothetical protein [Fredinandcohnia sp. SECRCQ15]MCH1625761.1 hypothetical protein [Fredinandcohnia sp. SECRCQ15]